MLLSMKSPNGGRPTQKQRFPLAQDKKGNFGIRLGYLEDGDPVIIRLSDADVFGSHFNCTVDTFWEKLGKMFTTSRRGHEDHEPVARRNQENY